MSIDRLLRTVELICIGVTLEPFILPDKIGRSMKQVFAITTIYSLFFVDSVNVF